MQRSKLAFGMPVALALSVVEFRMLRRTKPHPLGLASPPAAMPRMLESHGWEHGLTDMVLAYGYPFDTAKPLIEVATYFCEPDYDLPSVQQVLARAEHRDAAWERDDLEDMTAVFSPPDSPWDVAVRDTDFASDERTLTIDGEQATATVLSFGRYQGLHLRHGSMAVIAVARLGFPHDLSFQSVDDLEPYFAGRRRFVLSWVRLWQA